MNARRVVDDAEARRKRDLAMIHVAVKQLGWDRSMYEDILGSVCGVRSSGALDAAGRAKLIDHLRKCGFQPKPKRSARPLASDGESRMMRGLWIELHELGYVVDPSEDALAGWVRREAGVDALQWLGDRQRQSLIERLKQWRWRDVRKIERLVAAAVASGLIAPTTPARLAHEWCDSTVLNRAVATKLLQRLSALVSEQGGGSGQR